MRERILGPTPVHSATLRSTMKPAELASLFIPCLLLIRTVSSNPPADLCQALQDLKTLVQKIQENEHWDTCPTNPTLSSTAQAEHSRAASSPTPGTNETKDPASTQANREQSNSATNPTLSSTAQAEHSRAASSPTPGTTETKDPASTQANREQSNSATNPTVSSTTQAEHGRATSSPTLGTTETKDPASTQAYREQSNSGSDGKSSSNQNRRGNLDSSPKPITDKKLLWIIPVALTILVAVTIIALRNKCKKVHTNTDLAYNGTEKLYHKKGDITLLGLTLCELEGVDQCYHPSGKE